MAVAEVYSPAGEVESDLQIDDRKVERGLITPEEDVGSHPIEHSGVERRVCPRDGSTEFGSIAPEEDVSSHPLEHSGVEKCTRPRNGPTETRPFEHSGSITRSASFRKLAGRELLEHSVPSVTLCRGSEPSIADVQEQTEEGEAIVVGAVGSAAPWFLTGWTNV